MMFLEERTMMAMASSSSPRMRVHLLALKRSGEWHVWELLEELPPSTARERGPDRTQGLDGSQSECPSQQVFPALVMEVSADGAVVTWPGPEVLETTPS